MNGRVYDPEVGRFLQPDPMLDAGIQGLNRYSYVLNNPLSLTDPTGYLSVGQIMRIAAAVLVTWATGGAAAALWAGGSVGGALTVAALGGAFATVLSTGSTKGAGQGAFGAMVFFGIGSYFESAKWAKSTNDATKLSSIGRTAKIVAHGVTGGVLSDVQGGKFAHGFFSAGFSEAAGPLTAGVKNDLARGVLHALVGGTASKLSGGKFSNGAATAAMSFAFGRMASGERGGERDGGGEPHPESVSDTAVYRNIDWLESGALSIQCGGGECVLAGRLTVSYDSTWSRDEVFRWMAEIDHSWNTSHYNFSEGMRYSTRISLSFAAPGARGDLHFGYADLGFGSFARARVGEGVITMHTPIRGTAAHEFGHTLGFRHSPNTSGGMMSYAATRSVQPFELTRLVDAYRFPYAAGYKR